MAFYVICDDDSKHEGMTKEQILAAIAQAIEKGSIGNIDTGFVTKLKEQNSGCAVTIWVGTQAQYNAIAEKAVNCLYIITDDTTGEDLVKACVEAKEAAEEAWREVANAKSVNFTPDVTLTKRDTDGIKNLTHWECVPRRYEYDPGTGIVHYAFTLKFGGSISKYDEIVLLQSGAHLPNVKDYEYFPITAEYTENCRAAYVEIDGQPAIMITMLSDFQDMSNVTIEFCGWYFCGK